MEMTSGDAYKIFKNINLGYPDKVKMQAINLILKEHTDSSAANTCMFTRVNMFRVIRYLVKKIEEQQGENV